MPTDRLEIVMITHTCGHRAGRAVFNRLPHIIRYLETTLCPRCHELARNTR